MPKQTLKKTKRVPKTQTERKGIETSVPGLVLHVGDKVKCKWRDDKYRLFCFAFINWF